MIDVGLKIWWTQLLPSNYRPTQHKSNRVLLCMALASFAIKRLLRHNMDAEHFWI